MVFECVCFSLCLQFTPIQFPCSGRCGSSPRRTGVGVGAGAGAAGCAAAAAATPTDVFETKLMLSVVEGECWGRGKGSDMRWGLGQMWGESVRVSEVVRNLVREEQLMGFVEGLDSGERQNCD